MAEYPFSHNDSRQLERYFPFIAILSLHFVGGAIMRRDLSSAVAFKSLPNPNLSPFFVQPKIAKPPI